jgi:hypothetical protein
MNESPESTPAAAPTPETGEQPAGFLQNLVDVYFSPGEAFARIARRPAWILPAVGYLVLVVAFTAIWMNKMEPREFMKVQLEQSGQAEKMTAEQREQVIEQQARFMPIFGWVGSIVGTILTLVVIAALFLFIYRFFYGGELNFVQSLAVSSWVFFAVGLVTTPLMLTVLGLKSDWNLNPQEVLQANLTLLLDRSTAAKPLWALLAGIDLFSIWIVFLLATGYAAATRRRVGSAVWGVAIPWALVVLAKVAWAAIF